MVRKRKTLAALTKGAKIKWEITETTCLNDETKGYFITAVDYVVTATSAASGDTVTTGGKVSFGPPPKTKKEIKGVKHFDQVSDKLVISWIKKEVDQYELLENLMNNLGEISKPTFIKRSLVA